MELKGKVREDFKEWYDNEYFFGVERAYIDFNELPKKSMQFGVYVDFFNESDISVTIEHDLTTENEKQYFPIINYNLNYSKNNDYRDLVDAMDAAINKANDIYNNNH